MLTSTRVLLGRYSAVDSVGLSPPLGLSLGLFVGTRRSTASSRTGIWRLKRDEQETCKKSVEREIFFKIETYETENGVLKHGNSIVFSYYFSSKYL